MKTYTKLEVITLLRSHLIRATAGNLTSREFQMIGEVDLAIKEPTKESSLYSRVGRQYPKEVRA
jgi:hypothetical protein